MKRLAIALALILSLSMCFCATGCGTTQIGATLEDVETTDTVESVNDSSEVTEAPTEVTSTEAQSKTANMTVQELFEYLSENYGSFEVIEADDSTLYCFGIRSNISVSRYDSKLHTMYGISDFNSDTFALLEASSQYAHEFNESNEGAPELHDYFLEWCQDIEITPEQMISVLDYYATIQTENNNQKEIVAISYNDFYTNFASFFSNQPEFTLEELPVEIVDGEYQCYTAITLENGAYHEVFSLLVSCDYDMNITSVSVHVDTSSFNWSPIFYEIICYYAYSSMSLSEMDADTFYNTFGFRNWSSTTADILEFATIDGWRVASISSNADTFFVFIIEEAPQT